MWKWIVGAVLVVSVLVCAGAAAFAGWFVYMDHRRLDGTAFVEADPDAPTLQDAVDAQSDAATRQAALAEARAALAAGDHTAAERAFSTVLDGDPTNLEALVGRGRSYVRLERLDLAERDLAAAVEADPSRPDAWESLAWVLAAAGRDDEAVTAYDRLLALVPDDPKGLRDRANARYRTGDLAGARADARRSCDLGLQDGCALATKIDEATRGR